MESDSKRNPKNPLAEDALTPAAKRPKLDEASTAQPSDSSVSSGTVNASDSASGSSNGASPAPESADVSMADLPASSSTEPEPKITSEPSVKDGLDSDSSARAASPGATKKASVPEVSLEHSGYFDRLSSLELFRIWEFLSTAELSLTLGINRGIGNVGKMVFSRLSSAVFPKNNDHLYRSDGLMRNLLKFASENFLKKIIFSFTDMSAVVELLKNNPSVEVLFFDWRSFSPSFLDLISAESLRVLSVEYWLVEGIDLTEEEKDVPPPKDVMKELGRFSNLEALCVSVFDEPPDKCMFQNAFRNCSKLRVLDASSIKLLNYVVSALPHPEKLVAVSLSEIPSTFAKSLPGVREVVMNGDLTNESLHGLRGLQLERLTLAKAEGVTLDFVRSVFGAFPSLRYLGINASADQKTVLASETYQSAVFGHAIRVDVTPDLSFSSLCKHAQIDVL